MFISYKQVNLILLIENFLEAMHSYHLSYQYKLIIESPAHRFSLPSLNASIIAAKMVS